MTISIYDNDAYIRVVNGTTNVVVNYIKSSLVVQKDNNDSFFLRNDNFINYYKYVDVTTPSTNTIDELISTITGWNTTSAITTFEASMVDQLARLKVSNPLNLQLNIQNVFDESPMQIDQIITSNAAASYNSFRNAVNMNVISSGNSRIVRQSKLYPTHTYGSTSFAIVSGTLTTNITNSNMTSKIGVFDDSNDITSNSIGGNGVFFKYNNTSNLSLVYRTNYGGSQVDLEVAQSNWNIDTLNGSGVSAQTISPSQQTSFIFEWNQVTKSNMVRAGIYGNGLNYCHVFSNVQAFGNPSLPVRWEIGHDSNLGEPNAATLVQGPATVYTDTTYTKPHKTFSYNREEFVTMTSNGSEYPILSIRLQSEYIRAKIKPIEFELVNISGGGVGKWSLLLNSTLDTPSWTSLNHSYAAGDDSSTSVVASGTLLATGYFYDAGVTKVSLIDKQIELLAGITGNQDILTLRVELVNGTLNVGGSITWNESD